MPTKDFQDKIKTLYDSGKSMMEISLLMNCSVHKVVYWLEKIGVKRRTRSDALYLKLNPDGDPFTIKTQLTNEELLLFGLGLGIYWGEGEKVSKGAVRVTNTDPKIIKVFKQFLLQICQLRPEKISYGIISFNDIDPKEVAKYWAKQLETSESKFGKIVTIPSQGKGTYKKKSQFGVCILIVSNIKLKDWIMSQLRDIKADIV